MLVAFVFGPFIGPNIVVSIGGWETLNQLSPDGVAFAGAGVLGIIAGGLGWIVLARDLRTTPLLRRILTIGIFVLAALAGALAYVITGAALYIGMLPLCGVALTLWAAGLSALLAVPLLWGHTTKNLPS
jgi:hypothetical protein